MAAEVRRTAHLPKWKIQEVQELIEQIGKSSVVGVAGFRDIPASNLQQIRGDLRGRVEVRIVRNTIARRALETSSPKMRPLAEFIEDQTALIFSDQNPFKLNTLLQKGKQPMPIKAGARAPKDIVVEAGETPFSPGPMVGKLQAAGIPAAIKGGKVVINQKITLVKEGEVVSVKTADILKTMEIFPRNVGLELKAAYERGLIFKARELAIDIEGQISHLSTTRSNAFNFAVEINYITPQTIGPILLRAQTKAKVLVTEAGIPIPALMNLILGKAIANAKAIASVATREPVQGSADVQVAKGKKKKDEEEKKEEGDTAAGLGALFG